MPAKSLHLSLHTTNRGIHSNCHRAIGAASRMSQKSCLRIQIAGPLSIESVEQRFIHTQSCIKIRHIYII